MKSWVIAGLSIIVVLLAVWVSVLLRSRHMYRRASQSFDFLHQLTHDLREGIGEPGALPQINKERQDMRITHVIERILDNGANCVSIMTGEPVVACLLRPTASNEGLLDFQTVAYGGRPPNERSRKPSSAHKSAGLQKAFSVLEPMIYNDYDEALRNGTFVPARPDWHKFYMSALLTSFTTRGESGEMGTWGLLSFDSKEKHVFSQEWQFVACVFSDALGLVLSMHDPWAKR
jgi:hypothetical protein